MIDNFDFNNPVKLLFGAGKLNELGNHVKPLGDRCLLVTTGNFFVATGLVKRIQGILANSGIETVVYTEVSPNPLDEEVDSAAALAKHNDCDFIIGLGGGSSIDAAKGVAMAAGHDCPVWRFAMGTHDDAIEPTERTLPIVAIATTSGTGSHVTPYSVITNKQTKQKPGIGSEYLFAKVAVVDPELALSLPKEITASTGFDVLAHALEAYTCNISNVMTDLYAKEAIKLVGQNLVKAVADGTDLQARTAMAMADTYAGYAIAGSLVTLCHAIAHAVGGVSETVHGQTLAALTPHTVEFSMNQNPDKFKTVGLLLTGRSEEDLANFKLTETVAALRSLIAAIGMDIPLSEQGVTTTDLAEIAKGTTEYMGGIAEADVRPASFDDVMQILTKAF
ncbi:alcohol dehydrogenase [Neiella marina]|uniref:Alcohol dehydrogenase n=1 Tax=Neiella marina TaxID=508461 RepID=A0A8J2U3P3_9GAMM|nr:iron-containing alcohol dehydrogenase [Neiella marina]GGA71796.1 alcohol dehydrogenase [Neiella marina]